VEGLFALCWEELRALCDLKVFVDAPADLRLLRRIQRDLEERGRTVGSVLAQYLNTIRPMHERYVEPTRQHADLVVGNEGSVEECVTKISAAIQAIPRQRI
jgi:uridine kinase